MIRNGRDIQEEILSGFIPHGRFLELDLHSSIRVFNDLEDFGMFPSTDLSPDTLNEIKGECPEGKAPALVSDAVLPELLIIERREWLRGITYKASSSVSV